MEEQEYIKHIFAKYLEGKYAKEDVDFLLTECISNTVEGNNFEKLIEESLDNTQGFEKIEDKIDRIAQSTLHALRQEIKPKHNPIKLFFKIAASIVAVCGLSIAIYQIATDAQLQQIADQSTRSINKDVPPGRNQAVISIGDGKDMILDDGESAVEIGNSEIRYSDGQMLTQIKPSDMVQIRTPKGGQFQVRLSDGTKVWLNAETILRYSSQFGRDDRRVTLVGEAYFEVFKESADTRRTFTVESKGQEIKVLGTHFNVNAYPEELRTTTTLIEGTVKVTALDKNRLTTDRSSTKVPSEILKPGQQSILSAGIFKVRSADTEEALAWKNNMFIFNNTPLEQVMKNIARWYDVEIVYQDKSAITEVYAGSITRYESLSKVLRMLEKAGDTRFRLEEGRVVVMK